MEESSAPIFVKVEEYKDVLDIISNINDKLSQARNILERIITLEIKKNQKSSFGKLC